MQNCFSVRRHIRNVAQAEHSGQMNCLRIHPQRKHSCRSNSTPLSGSANRQFILERGGGVVRNQEAQRSRNASESAWRSRLEAPLSLRPECIGLSSPASSGHLAAVPPKNAMKSRRRISP
jgi:hypothetical protein